MSLYLQNALLYAKDLDKSLKLAVDELNQMPDPYGLVSAFRTMFQACKSDSEKILSNLEKASIEYTEKR